MLRAPQTTIPILFASVLAAQSNCRPGPIRATNRVASQNKPVDLDRYDLISHREELRTLYELSGRQLIWLRGVRPTDRALQMIAVLKDAESKGLTPVDYDSPRWSARVSELSKSADRPSNDTLAQFDVMLSLSVMRYISDLRFGRVDPGLYRSGRQLESERMQLPHLVDGLVKADNLELALERIEPPFDGYRRTLQALTTYRHLMRQEHVRLLPIDSKVVEPGQESSITPRVVHFLRMVGDLAPDAELSPNPLMYSGAVVEAVKRFQARHGLEADGRIGKATFAQLNTPLASRVRQLELTLERWRWVPHEYPRPPLVVNLPEFRLRAYDSFYRPELEMKIVAGRAHRHKTPVFAGELKYVVFRPYWNVPLSIQRAELIPQIQRNRNYLARNGYEVITPAGAVVTRDFVSDQVLALLHSGRLFLRQRPGPDNALGLVKFIFPNEYNAYLHDTPARALFERSRRDFSHGCMRIERAHDLAVWALREEPGWSEDRVLAAMNGTKTIQVNLTQPIPVLIVYGTAVVLESGQVLFLEDIYGYDAILERELTARNAARYSRIPRPLTNDRL